MQPPEQVSAYQLDKVDGVYVNQVIEESSAEKAGIKVGDFITKIENKEIKTGPQMLEKIAQYRPGDEINIEYLRNGNKYNTSAKLKNISGNTGIVKKMPFSTEKLGIKVKDLTKEELAGLRVKNGVIITNITPGDLIASQVRLRKSFVIVQVNGQAVKSTNDLDKKNIKVMKMNMSLRVSILVIQPCSICLPSKTNLTSCKVCSSY